MFGKSCQKEISEQYQSFFTFLNDILLQKIEQEGDYSKESKFLNTYLKLTITIINDNIYLLTKKKGYDNMY